VWHKQLDFGDSEGFVELMRSVLDWMAQGVGFWCRQREGADIFAVVAGSFDEQVMATLIEAIETGSKDQIQAVGSALCKAHRTLVWDNVPFVTRALRTAAEYGEDCVQAIGGGFHGSVIAGGRWGTPGQPFREDVEQRDKSAEIAAKLARGSIEQRFYQSLIASAESRIRWEEKNDRVFADGRDW